MPSGEVFTGPGRGLRRGPHPLHDPVEPARRGGRGDRARVPRRAGRRGARRPAARPTCARRSPPTPARRCSGRSGSARTSASTARSGRSCSTRRSAARCTSRSAARIPRPAASNESAVHWDMICDLRGGGRLSADGAPLLADGRFRGRIAGLARAGPGVMSRSTWMSRCALLAAALVALRLAAAPAGAAPGDLDPSFSNDGRVSTLTSPDTFVAARGRRAAGRADRRRGLLVRHRHLRADGRLLVPARALHRRRRARHRLRHGRDGHDRDRGRALAGLRRARAPRRQDRRRRGGEHGLLGPRLVRARALPARRPARHLASARAAAR